MRSTSPPKESTLPAKGDGITKRKDGLYMARYREFINIQLDCVIERMGLCIANIWVD